MSNVIPFKKKKPGAKHKGKTLCKSGFHKWLVDTEQKFDTRAGKLVTVYRCSRCGALKNEAR